MKVVPKVGKGVLFFSLEDDNETVREDSLHAGMPVLRGEKYMCNKWIPLNLINKKLIFLFLENINKRKIYKTLIYKNILERRAKTTTICGHRFKTSTHPIIHASTLNKRFSRV